MNRDADPISALPCLLALRWPARPSSEVQLRADLQQPPTFQIGGHPYCLSEPPLLFTIELNVMPFISDLASAARRSHIGLARP